jgi:hypothetical protein
MLDRQSLNAAGRRCLNVEGDAGAPNEIIAPRIGRSLNGSAVDGDFNRSVRVLANGRPRANQRLLDGSIEMGVQIVRCDGSWP